MSDLDAHIESFASMLIAKSYDKVQIVTGDPDQPWIYGQPAQALRDLHEHYGRFPEKGIELRSHFHYTEVDWDAFRYLPADPVIDYDWKKNSLRVHYDGKEGFKITEQKIAHDLYREFPKPIVLPITENKEILSARQAWNELMPLERVSVKGTDLER